MVDREQIQQVFLNLLLNAIKSMPQGGQLEIAMQRMDDIDGMGVGVLAMGMDDVHAYESYVRVRFRDTGCGIDENKLAKVFDPFFTTDPAGTGLGLSIAHKLIEENNGVIYIESIPGRGTDVIVLLPTVES
jgi:signal transduction histidine kinase